MLNVQAENLIVYRKLQTIPLPSPALGGYLLLVLCHDQELSYLLDLAFLKLFFIFMCNRQCCSLIGLFYDQLRFLFQKIKLKINFELKLILFLILEFLSYLSLLTLRTHIHCCSTHCEMKSMNKQSKSENTRRLISSYQTVMMTKISAI